jgi:hypothetical protein
MICELIALACLAAHGDIEGTQSNKMQKAYDADQIIKTLTNLHPSFYPVPKTQMTDKDNEGVFRQRKIASGFLTKRDLLELYGEAGVHLHRGSMKKVISGKRMQTELALPRAWAERIWNLLKLHEIQTIDPDIMMIGMMRDTDESRPQFSFWRRDGETPDGMTRWRFVEAVRSK